jgi:ABC-2 type transport system ATP-binding protein
MLEVIGVAKSYFGVMAVRNLNLTASPGQVIGLLGPNGSGKTTTVRMLVGLLRPTHGLIRWHGAHIHDGLLGYQARMGYVPEEPRLYPYLTAPEYLELVGGLRDIAQPTLGTRVDRYLHLFGLDADRYAPLSAFSKGMRQKVLIAAALLHDPDLIVFDEPCSGLDVASTMTLRALVGALAAQGKTIIYSSHVLDMVEKICQEVVILHNGHVVAHDSVTRLRELARVASLEQVFASLAVDDDVERIGVALAEVARA